MYDLSPYAIHNFNVFFGCLRLIEITSKFGSVQKTGSQPGKPVVSEFLLLSAEGESVQSQLPLRTDESSSLRW